MTSSSAVYNEEYAPTTSNAEPHAPSSRSGAHKRPGSRDSPISQDAERNMLNRKATSGTQTRNSSTRTTVERQTERVRMTVRDSVRTRAPSSWNENSGAGMDIGDPEVLGPSRANSRVIEKQSRRKKEVLRKWTIER